MKVADANVTQLAVVSAPVGAGLTVPVDQIVPAIHPLIQAAIAAGISPIATAIGFGIVRLVTHLWKTGRVRRGEPQKPPLKR